MNAQRYIHIFVVDAHMHIVNKQRVDMLLSQRRWVWFRFGENIDEFWGDFFLSLCAFGVYVVKTLKAGEFVPFL